MEEPLKNRRAKPRNFRLIGSGLMIIVAVTAWCYLTGVTEPAISPAASENSIVLENNFDTAPIARADNIPLETFDEGIELADHSAAGHGKVIVVRGILTIFSLGLDDLAKKMRSAGYDVEVTMAAQAGNTARRIRDEMISTGDQRPLIIVGHSLGGDLAPKLAKVFAEKGRYVDVLLMLDSTMPTSPPPNVKTCINMYQDNGTPDWARLFRGKSISAQSHKTQMINIDIRKLANKDKTAGINHFNIDANPWIHNVIIGALGRMLPQHQRSALISPYVNQHRVDRHPRQQTKTYPVRYGQIPNSQSPDYRRR